MEYQWKEIISEDTVSNLDFNRDGRLDRGDLTEIVFRLTGEERDGRPNMDVHQLSMVVQKVLDEVDTKKLGYIQPADFINLMGKSSNFAQNFCIRFWSNSETFYYTEIYTLVVYAVVKKYSSHENVQRVLKE